MDGCGSLSIEDASGELTPAEGLYNIAKAFKFTAKCPNGVEIQVADSTAKLMPQIAELMQKDGKDFDLICILFEGENGQWVYVSRGTILANPKEILRGKPEVEETSHLVSREP